MRRKRAAQRAHRRSLAAMQRAFYEFCRAFAQAAARAATALRQVGVAARALKIDDIVRYDLRASPDQLIDIANPEET